MPGSKFYVTTPIYYVNDVPAHRARVHDGRGRRPRPVAPPVGRRRRLPHRHRRARPQDRSGRPRRRGITPQELGRRDQRARSARPGTLLDITNDDFIRTTEPRHHAAVQEFLQRGLRRRRHRARHLRGPLLRLVRGLLHRGRARRRQLPDPRPPGRARHRGELLLPALALRGPAARALRRASRGGAARRRGATRCSGSSSRACATSR